VIVAPIAYFAAGRRGDSAVEIDHLVGVAVVEAGQKPLLASL
jgi:hypothetical protein